MRPIELATLEVKLDAVCQPDRVGDCPAATLWEEARKALERVEWTRAGGALDSRVHLYDRRLDRRGRVVDERTRDLEVESIRPFDTAPAETLAREGFVHATGKDTLYFGPDAEVLLSDAFARTHCFRSAAGEPGRIGLAFEPLDGDRSDIAGVLWLDETSAELRTLEFHYTGPIAAAVDEPYTGRMAFRRLPAGHWIVDEWSIRLPRDTRPLVWNRGPVRSRARRRLRFVGWWERGGRVASAIAPDGSSMN